MSEVGHTRTYAKWFTPNNFAVRREVRLNKVERKTSSLPNKHLNDLGFQGAHIWPLNWGGAEVKRRFYAHGPSINQGIQSRAENAVWRLTELANNHGMRVFVTADAWRHERLNLLKSQTYRIEGLTSDGKLKLLAEFTINQNLSPAQINALANNRPITIDSEKIVTVKVEFVTDEYKLNTVIVGLERKGATPGKAKKSKKPVATPEKTTQEREIEKRKKRESNKAKKAKKARRKARDAADKKAAIEEARKKKVQSPKAKEREKAKAERAKVREEQTETRQTQNKTRNTSDKEKATQRKTPQAQPPPARSSKGASAGAKGRPSGNIGKMTSGAVSGAAEIIQMVVRVNALTLAAREKARAEAALERKLIEAQMLRDQGRVVSLQLVTLHANAELVAMYAQQVQEPPMPIIFSHWILISASDMATLITTGSPAEVNLPGYPTKKNPELKVANPPPNYTVVYSSLHFLHATPSPPYSGNLTGIYHPITSTNLDRYNDAYMDRELAIIDTGSLFITCHHKPITKGGIPLNMSSVKMYTPTKDYSDQHGWQPQFSTWVILLKRPPHARYLDSSAVGAKSSKLKLERLGMEITFPDLPFEGNFERSEFFYSPSENAKSPAFLLETLATGKIVWRQVAFSQTTIEATKKSQGL